MSVVNTMPTLLLITKLKGKKQNDLRLNTLIHAYFAESQRI